MFVCLYWIFISYKCLRFIVYVCNIHQGKFHISIFIVAITPFLISYSCFVFFIVLLYILFIYFFILYPTEEGPEELQPLPWKRQSSGCGRSLENEKNIMSATLLKLPYLIQMQRFDPTGSSSGFCLKKTQTLPKH